MTDKKGKPSFEGEKIRAIEVRRRLLEHVLGTREARESLP